MGRADLSIRKVVPVETDSSLLAGAEGANDREDFGEDGRESAFNEQEGGSSGSKPLKVDRALSKYPIKTPHYWAPGGTNDPDGKLLRCGADAIQEAALRGDVCLVARQVEAGAPACAPLIVSGSDEYLTLLHVLACRPSTPNAARVGEELIKGKADVNARGTLGSTPIMLACLHKHIEFAEMLLAHGANTAAVDDNGYTATRAAVIVNKPFLTEGGAESLKEAKQLSVQILHCLKAHASNLDLGGDQVPVVEAILQNNLPAVQALLESGATPDGLIEAVLRAQLPTVQLLIKNKVNPFVKNEAGVSCLQLANSKGDKDKMKIKLALGNYIRDLERERHQHLGSKHDLDLDTAPGKPEERNSAGLGRRRQSVLTGNVEDDNESEGAVTVVTPTPETAAKEPEYVDENGWKVTRSRLQVRRFLRNPLTEGLLTTNLFAALLVPDIWTILEFQGEEGLDHIMIVIFTLFAFEMSLHVYTYGKQYLHSIGFWCDLLGIISVPMNTSLFVKLATSHLGHAIDQASLSRITKFVKLSARAGRLSRLVKLLRFLPNSLGKDSTSTARQVASKLNTELGFRVAALVIILVVLIPLLEFWRDPTQDLSMYLWAYQLHYVARDVPDQLEDAISEMVGFYENRTSYFPFAVSFQLDDQPGQDINFKIPAPSFPIRVSDTVTVSAASPGAKTSVSFNFRESNVLEACITVALICTIVTVIFTTAALTSGTLASILLKPMQEVLTGVQQVSQKILDTIEKLAIYSVKDHATTEQEDKRRRMSQPVEHDVFREVVLLSHVMQKLSLLNQIADAKRPIDEFEQLSQESRWVCVDYATMAARTHATTLARTGKSTVEEYSDFEPLMESIGLELDAGGLKREDFSNWELNTIEINAAQRKSLERCILLCYDVHPGFDGSSAVDLKKFTCHSRFLEELQKGYSEPDAVPYHNWIHAVDTAFSLRCLFSYVQAEQFLSQAERFALIMSAFAHNLGHPGVNNSYLIAKEDYLSTTYNDASVLQNNSCALLFGILNQPSTNVFAHMPKNLCRDMRQLCISAILHTDLAHHPSVVAELRAVYLGKEEIFNMAKSMNIVGPAGQSEHGGKILVKRAGSVAVTIDDIAKERDAYFQNPEVKLTLRKSLLHFVVACSSSTKPWDVCHEWADLQFQEFFLQGDSEKDYRMPVQVLNDRVRVNVPYAQIQYITFFAAQPTVLMATMFPSLRNMVAQLWENQERWVMKWERGNPDPDEKRRVAARIRHMQEQEQENPANILADFHLAMTSVDSQPRTSAWGDQASPEEDSPRYLT
mmetsp:Transcript_19710/g.34987  ORF Transcript_19710/g.34987 Transcript_19710/m.34987 type:complete len:1287 (-) Transcript_19710:14-3874(-)